MADVKLKTHFSFKLHHSCPAMLQAELLHSSLLWLLQVDTKEPAQVGKSKKRQRQRIYLGTEVWQMWHWEMVHYKQKTPPML